MVHMHYPTTSEYISSYFGREWYGLNSRLEPTVSYSWFNGYMVIL